MRDRVCKHGRSTSPVSSWLVEDRATAEDGSPRSTRHPVRAVSCEHTCMSMIMSVLALWVQEFVVCSMLLRSGDGSAVYRVRTAGQCLCVAYVVTTGVKSS